MEPVHALHSYFASQLIFGARHVDVLSETEDRNLLLDLRRFHKLEPSPPTPPPR